uniref:Uncharacterized protein n=1 Tax=Arundo donax TaxID=35708 RepID=A0A0A9I020_ARUDO
MQLKHVHAPWFVELTYHTLACRYPLFFLFVISPYCSLFFQFSYCFVEVEVVIIC